MLYSLMESVTGTMDAQTAVICLITSLILGVVIAGIYMIQGNYTKNYIVTLAVLPMLVQVVIMLVNGNLGTSVAVMGAFSLVRFRSIPGTSREIIGIFFAMVIGLATGMGFVSYAVLATVIIGVSMLILTKCKFGEEKESYKLLKVSIPENLDYTDIFDDLFNEYTKSAVLNTVKTTNMGSMFELQYHIKLKNQAQEKEFIDRLRCRNGNLTISCSRPMGTGAEL